MTARILLPLSFLLFATAALADRTETPRFDVEGLPLKAQRASVDVAGVIARVELEQVWVNEGEKAIEAVYRFPGSTRAAVSDLVMKIGERTIRADIQEKKEARKTYEGAKRAGKTASLLEQEKPNLFSMNVANIQPGDEVVVTLTYHELLVPEGGVYELVVPQAWVPRYSSGDDWKPNPAVEAPKLNTLDWSVDLNLKTPMAVRAMASPSHALAPEWTGKTSARVHLEKTADDPGFDRDFILRYRLADDAIEAGVMMYRQERSSQRSENFFTLVVEPPKTVAPEDVPSREIVFLLDVSGSMRGFPLDTGKYLMRELTRDLRAHDRINALFFAGGNRVLWDDSVPATEHNVAALLEAVDGQRGGGGTQLDRALDTALAMKREGGESRVYVVITDGAVSFEQGLFDKVRDHLGDANLFTFGIGSSTNRYLIEGLANVGKGHPFVVSQASEARAQADKFLRRVKTPALTNIELSYQGFDAYDVIPANLPDVFPDRPLVVMGKFRGPSSGKIVLSGITGSGRFERSIRVEDNREQKSFRPLRALWAREKVRDLTAYRELTGDDKEAVTQLGLRYRLLTKTTSFVAVDSERRGDGSPLTVEQPVPLADGVDGQLLGGGYGFGSGGLGLRGTGAGGGGRAAAYGALSALGTSPRGGISNGISLSGRGKSRASVRMAAPTAVAGSLDKNVILRVIKAHQRQIRHCYERQLQRSPKLAGKLMLSFTIGPDGRVRAAKLKQDTVGDDALGRCVVSRIKRMRFPKPAGGGTVEVAYPFIFRPQ
jgi:Ca-activated chloride channel family protein